MRVRMTATISGTRNGRDWPRRGQEIDLPEAEAAALCAQKLATPVARRPAEEVETTLAPAATEEQRAEPSATDTGLRPGPRKRTRRRTGPGAGRGES